MENFPKEHQDEMRILLEKMSLRDVVVFHYACSKECRDLQLPNYRVFEGEPFFLRFSPLETNQSYYAFSLNRWVHMQLPSGLPVSLLNNPNLRPVSSSGGLLLLSTIPGGPCYGSVRARQSSWPLLVFNPVTRDYRILSLELELPAQIRDILYLEDCSGILVGLKVSADSKTYKIVVHWKKIHVVQIYDSESRRWSTLMAPRQLDTFANSSTDIVACYSQLFADFPRSSLVDIRRGRVIDCRFREDLRALGIVPSTTGPEPREITTASDSCLYALNYNTFPTTALCIHKKERHNQNWELITEAPWRALMNSTGNLGTRAEFDIYVCGKLLLLAVSFPRSGSWGGVLYELDNQVWNPNFVVNRAPPGFREHPGFRAPLWQFRNNLFFQPQLNGPPC